MTAFGDIPTKMNVSDVDHNLKSVKLWRPTGQGYNPSRTIHTASLSYPHLGLSYTSGKALSECHVQILAERLRVDLRRQEADLDYYLSALQNDMHRALDTWGHPAPYQELVPASAPELEHRLFLINLEALLQLPRNKHLVS